VTYCMQRVCALYLDGCSVGEQSCSSISMPDSYWPSSNALSTRAACLVVSSLSPRSEGDIVCGGEVGESDEWMDNLKGAAPQNSRGWSASASNLVTITTRTRANRALRCNASLGS